MGAAARPPSLASPCERTDGQLLTLTLTLTLALTLTLTLTQLTMTPKTSLGRRKATQVATL